jgi:hypothetical protein
MRSHNHHVPRGQGNPVNIPLCFSTVQTILDYVASAPGQDDAEALKHFELLRADLDIKIHAIKKRFDKLGKMGLISTS